MLKSTFCNTKQRFISWDFKSPSISVCSLISATTHMHMSIRIHMSICLHVLKGPQQIFCKKHSYQKRGMVLDRWIQTDRS